jgi:Ras-related protein Rab-8A
MAAAASGGKSYDLQIKLMMIGDQAVGKTALLLRYADDDFNEVLLPTIGIDFKIKTIELQGKRVKLQIWDTAGQERFRTITQAYYRGAMGILLVYDVTNSKSWSNVRNWVRNIEGNAPQTVNKILVGNKCDLASQRQVSTQQGEQLAREYGIKFFETSARNNLNVKDAFLTLATDVVERLAAGGAGAGDVPTVGLSVQSDASSSKKYGCC